jgi:hypothetical protein
MNESCVTFSIWTHDSGKKVVDFFFSKGLSSLFHDGFAKFHPGK